MDDELKDYYSHCHEAEVTEVEYGVYRCMECGEVCTPICITCGGEGIIEYQNGNDFCECQEGEKKRHWHEDAADFAADMEIERAFLRKHRLE